MSTILNFLAAQMGWLVLGALAGMLIIVACLSVLISSLHRRVTALEKAAFAASAERTVMATVLSKLQNR